MIEDRLDENVEETVRKKCLCAIKDFLKLEESWCTHTAREGDWDQWVLIYYTKNIHICPRQGQVPGPIVSFCANPVPSVAPGLGPMQCD